MKKLIYMLFISQVVNASDFSPIGVWLVADGGAKIEIYAPNTTNLEGKIIWLKEPLEKDGTAKKDIKNPDEKLNSRPILGMVLIEGFKKDKNEWSGGTIYDAKSGKTYKAKMELDGDNKLKLRGYVGVPMFGRTEVWTRQAL